MSDNNISPVQLPVLQALTRDCFSKKMEIVLDGRVYRNPLVTKKSNGQEIIVVQVHTGAENKLEAFNLATGQKIWEKSGSLSAPYTARPVAVYVPGRSRTEIIAQLEPGKLSTYDVDTGNVLNANLINIPEHLFLSPKIKDINSDGSPDVLVPSYKPGGPNTECQVDAYNLNGSFLWRRPLVDGLNENMELAITENDGRALIASARKAYVFYQSSGQIDKEIDLPDDSQYAPVLSPDTLAGRGTAWFSVGNINKILGYDWRWTSGAPAFEYTAPGVVKDLQRDQNNNLLFPCGSSTNTSVRIIDGVRPVNTYALGSGLQISKNVVFNVHLGTPEIFAVTGRYYPAKIYWIKNSQVSPVDTLSADDFAHEAGIIYRDGLFIVGTEGATNNQGKVLIYERKTETITGVPRWNQYE